MKNDYWVAVMKGGELEPHKSSDEYAGYGVQPIFYTKKECENWIKDYNEKHIGEWLSRKSYLENKNSEESAIWEKGAKVFAEQLKKELMKDKNFDRETILKISEKIKYLGA